MKKALILFFTTTSSIRGMSTSCVDKYGVFQRTMRDINSLEGIQGILGWDELVMQPSGASGAKARQKETLAGVIHEKKTDKELGVLLNDLSMEASGLSAVQKRNVEIAFKDYHKATALPMDLSKRIAALESEGYHAWIAARSASDYQKFKPTLSEWVSISLQKAKLIDPKSDPYDVLLDDFESGMTGARLDEIFSELRAGLQPLIKDIRTKGTPPSNKCFAGKKFDVGVQAKMCEAIAQDLGFSLEKGRLDVSVHPFTGGSHPTDVRMTTRFKDDLTEGLTGAVHETGHSLYEMGRNTEEGWLDMPISKALSMGVHESQSLLWERMVALSRPFQTYLLKKLNDHFPGEFDGITADELYGAMNIVKPSSESFIRVEADEVTYSMHVLLRYEIERELIAGTLSVDDVPSAWNAKMKEYLDTTVEDDAKGVLQDVHWSAGAIGYFPTYTLGAMMAVQIFEQARSELGGQQLDGDIANGEFTKLRQWLNAKVHRQGSDPKNFDELMVRVTGRPLDPAVYMAFLREKYTALYKF